MYLGLGIILGHTRGHIHPHGVQGLLLIIQCPCIKMVCNANGCSGVTQKEIWGYMGTLDLIVFKATLRSSCALVIPQSHFGSFSIRAIHDNVHTSVVKQNIKAHGPLV